jgi:hypothetical protein
VAFNWVPPHLLLSLDFVGPQAEEFGLNISPLNILFYFSKSTDLGFESNLPRWIALLVEKVVVKVIAPAPPPPPDKQMGHWMV